MLLAKEYKLTDVSRTGNGDDFTANIYGNSVKLVCRDDKEFESVE